MYLHKWTLSKFSKLLPLSVPALPRKGVKHLCSFQKSVPAAQLRDTGNRKICRDGAMLTFWKETGDIKSDYGNKKCETVGCIELSRRSSASSCEVYQGSPNSIHWRATRVCPHVWKFGEGGGLNLVEHRYLERWHLFCCCLLKLPYRPVGLL